MVTVGLPVHNGAAHLHGAMTALCAQTFSDFEVIVSDNASTDETADIVSSFAKNDPRIRYVRQQQNTGAQANFRYVLDHARGRYFTWLAHDDVWGPRYLERLVSLLEARPEVVLAFSRFDNIDGDGLTVRTFSTNWGEIWQKSKLLHLCYFVLSDNEKTQKANHIYGLIRREVLLATGELLSYDIYNGSDIVQLCSLLMRGDFAVADEILFHYRAPTVSQGTRSVLTLNVRPRGAGLRYLWHRAFGAAPGHTGNLLTALARHHYLYRAVLELIIRNRTISPPQRALLIAVVWLGEAKHFVTRHGRLMRRELFG